ncbi:type I-E CRISPR-associated protein Cse2/CasB [Pseudodesulfovibrio senegalensis]|uniref:Type I-E CRISPR-associated protein Cse2/CasB n=1 Tax=Pseudodesulfovibrio senegalensis TaxID=1721087 RepID=A0A6N6N5W0_9BACT|nr:type I-E CRISPR-associated protein Cse2/CasB [Pseudodesulfovibrio senegalensis]KAB1442875.1 type I-E CRISPR-associated protein Cse2/CasB [Pseudodesulfovibrio senegalensis]
MMKLDQAFNDDGFWKAVESWWHGLDKDRGQRAGLRRAKSRTEVYVSPAYRNGLVEKLARFELDEPDLERLALAAGVLAKARHLRKGHFAAVFAREGKGSPDMRDVRFRKLLAVEDGEYDELYRMLVRFVDMCGGAASLGGLIRHTMYWNDQARMNWAREYYPNRSKA